LGIRLAFKRLRRLRVGPNSICDEIPPGQSLLSIAPRAGRCVRRMVEGREIDQGPESHRAAWWRVLATGGFPCHIANGRMVREQRHRSEFHDIALATNKGSSIPDGTGA
jgi:hypothetical protein